MAYDYGVQSLGIQNPFKTEGAIRTTVGTVIALLGVFGLFRVGSVLKVGMASGWAQAIGALVLIVWGMWTIGGGSFQLFRYFVGRSVPTSLAYNYNPSDRDNANAEKSALVYDAQKVESMLMGRKNSTFQEPFGWLGKLTHTLFPKLIFLPHLMRSYAQHLITMIASTLTVLVTFSLAYFISAIGLIGEAGALVSQTLSILLLLVLLRVWHQALSALSAARSDLSSARGNRGIVSLVLTAVLGPVVLSFLYQQLPADTYGRVLEWSRKMPGFNPLFNFVLLFLVCGVALYFSWRLFEERFNLTDANTEVSEFRENIQESVHPKEIFINIENIVMANRRYREIPNRVYQLFDPQLEEQSQGKGNFRGQVLIETQPSYREIPYTDKFKLNRLMASVAGQFLCLLAAYLFFLWIGKLIDFMSLIDGQLGSETVQGIGSFFLSSSSTEAFFSLLARLISLFTLFCAGMILTRGAHLFWSEMHFSSLLVWLKTEGTYTESTISTGMSIHDSTRSENVVVRSSITLWIITSRIVTSTFATSGINNLEMPRYIMTLNKNPQELDQIVDEIKTFLRGRENIASIQNEKDLYNAGKIYRINEASRIEPPSLGSSEMKVDKLSEYAGKIRQDEEGRAD